jgi:hypothetical protein
MLDSTGHMFRVLPQQVLNRHKRPIASHFHSGGAEFSYLSEDLDEADGEPEVTTASVAV